MTTKDPDACLAKWEYTIRTSSLMVQGNWHTIATKTDNKVHDALTYAMTYCVGMRSTDHVDIRVSEHDCELSAYYSYTTEKGDKRGFLLAGIWHPSEKKYSWHS